MIRIGQRSETDDIIAYLQYAGPDELRPYASEHMHQRIKRLYRCADLIKQYGARHKVCPMLQTEFGISRQTADRDFQDTQIVFGATLQSSKDFWVDVLMGMMMESRSKALIKGDMRSVSAIEKNMYSVVEKLVGDRKTLPFDQVQPVMVQVGFFPELTNVEVPDNLEAQVKKLLQDKKSKTFDTSHIQDAEVVEDGAD